MAKRLLSVRLDDEDIAALARAAADDKRPPAMLARLILHEWLAERSYTKATTHERGIRPLRED